MLNFQLQLLTRFVPSLGLSFLICKIEIMTLTHMAIKWFEILEERYPMRAFS